MVSKTTWKCNGVWTRTVWENGQDCMTCPDLLIKENVMEYRTEVSKMEDKEWRMWEVTNKDGSV